MTRMISNAERRAVEHETIARESIENADTVVAMAEREIIAEIDRPGGEADFNRRWLVHYAAARRHLESARAVLAA